MRALATPFSKESREQKKNIIRLALLPILLVLLMVVMLIAVGTGSVDIPANVAIAILLSKAGITTTTEFTNVQESVLWIVRLPRVVMGALVGAGLAVAGAMLQGVFRNPLADPGLIGVSSGAAMGSVAVVMLGITTLDLFTIPVGGFIGALLVTLMVYKLSQRSGRTDITTMLLVGLAVNAIAGSATGIMTFMADDPRLRSVTFWTMGGLNDALWDFVKASSPFILLTIIIAPFMGRALNLFSLGETEARHLGIETERTKHIALILSTIATGAAVAAAGFIGFIGLIVPHLIRLVAGPDHRLLLPACALGGASLVVGADVLARTIAEPAEIPVGLIAAIIGGPFFLIMILRTQRLYGWK
jgi:iron complex transport system permease protein